MTDRIALALGLAIVTAIGLNFALGWQAHIFLGRQFVALIDTMAFWR